MNLDPYVLAIVVAVVAAFATALFMLRGGSEPPAKPSPPPEKKPAPAPAAPPRESAPRESVSRMLPSMPSVLDEDDEDLTLITVMPFDPVVPITIEEPVKEEPKKTGTEDSAALTALPKFFDEEAAVDEQTRPNALILVAGAGQTDQGKKRKRNEDSYLQLPDEGLFAIADGMGGYEGGALASQTAVETLERAFKDKKFDGDIEKLQSIPRRGAELAIAFQMANKAVHTRAQSEPKLSQMGTTLIAARFSPNKQRVYIGHVGDSRAYRLRGEEFRQVTQDHTMAEEGVPGPLGAHLTRAVGISPGVKVDIIIDKPRPGDLYLLCSDGLSKMVGDDQIRKILIASKDVEGRVGELISIANQRGGKDNITVILVQVLPAISAEAIDQAQKPAVSSPN